MWEIWLLSYSLILKAHLENISTNLIEVISIYYVFASIPMWEDELEKISKSPVENSADISNRNHATKVRFSAVHGMIKYKSVLGLGSLGKES